MFVLGLVPSTRKRKNKNKNRPKCKHPANRKGVSTEGIVVIVKTKVLKGSAGPTQYEWTSRSVKEFSANRVLPNSRSKGPVLGNSSHSV